MTEMLEWDRDLVFLADRKKERGEMLVSRIEKVPIPGSWQWRMSQIGVTQEFLWRAQRDVFLEMATDVRWHVTRNDCNFFGLN